MERPYQLEEQRLSKTTLDEMSYTSSVSSSMPSQKIDSNITKKFLNSRTRIKKLKEKIIYIFDYRKDTRNPECKKEILTSHVLKKLCDEKQWELLKHPYMLNFINENLIYTPEVYFLHILTYIFFFMLLYSFIFVEQNLFQMLLLKCSILFFFEFMIFRFFLSFHKHKDLTDRFALFHYSSILAHTIIILLIWNIILFSFKDYIEGTKIILLCFFSIILISSILINFFYLTNKWFYGTYITVFKKIVMPIFRKPLLLIPTTVAGLIFAILNYTVNIDELNSNNILTRIFWSVCIYFTLLEIFLIFQPLNLFFVFDLTNYCKLRNNFDNMLLKEKVNHCLECLEMIEACKFLNRIGWLFTVSRTNNILVINTKEISSYSLFESSVKINSTKKHHKSERRNLNLHSDKEDDSKDILGGKKKYRKNSFDSNNNLLLQYLFSTSEILEYKGKITGEMIDHEEHWLKKFKCLFSGEKQCNLDYEQLTEKKVQDK